GKLASDGFTEGVEPGGLKSADEIKILICYLLKSVGSPLSFDNLNDILQHDGLCNYFSFASALHELLVSGHIDLIKADDNELYKNTSLGAETAELFERRLPASVREKAVGTAVKLLAKIKRESENSAVIEENPSGGYNVTCSSFDMGDTLMSVKLLVVGKDQAELIKRRFQQTPDIIYKGVLALMTGDVKAAAELITPEQEN
ncbi:MAG TPA: DUF4364 family protein, partial [Ruminiclostridium sp.]|nr:DUF4364 family protein [Ruminiclostridium sp.]